ncbi:hypothetical protein CHI12_10900 [Terribacillus saccharophilus]|jgi:hypothetical protein|uniref:DUF3397 domain-containing protein n=1 Tax=Terribacillus saccharophilus TaxID=361277 RepID=A0A268HCI1_9BACI|nr:DUF3397 domain-containing protein [Terribacillus saccharophilus]PAD37231.1 hypothetical protein CHH56_00385 [Terribacillus saccharophilus]PAD97327.1 hypothetical protein CHH50_01090 [Terribacillus saccharophilus]PAE01375.1 hypothetical protein CHH48_01080 [Terribacillus saccharophilus]PAE07540.1 hypothetical protein CHI12_10900 [Terribacillus saccharophilus]
MTHLFAYLLAAAITVPPLATWIYYLIVRRIIHKRRNAFLHSVQTTAVFYIFSVMIMLQIILQHTVFGYMIGFLAVLFIMVVLMHYKYRGEIVFKHVWRIFLRICFLLFGPLYILLLVAGVIVTFIRQ